MASSAFLPTRSGDGDSDLPRFKMCADDDVLGGAIDATIILSRYHNEKPAHWLMTSRARRALLMSTATYEVGCDATMAESETLLNIPIKPDAGDLPNDGSFILVGDRGTQIRVAPVRLPRRHQKAA